MVRAHHEWYNGEGYPDGIRGDEIRSTRRSSHWPTPFDAMTTERPYREALSSEEAIDEILQFRGRGSLRKLADAFAKMVRETPPMDDTIFEDPGAFDDHDLPSILPPVGPLPQPTTPGVRVHCRQPPHGSSPRRPPRPPRRSPPRTRPSRSPPAPRRARRGAARDTAPAPPRSPPWSHPRDTPWPTSASTEGMTALQGRRVRAGSRARRRRTGRRGALQAREWSRPRRRRSPSRRTGTPRTPRGKWEEARKRCHGKRCRHRPAPRRTRRATPSRRARVRAKVDRLSRGVDG